MIETYNAEVNRWVQRTNREVDLDDFLLSDDERIKWSRNLKRELNRNKIAEYAEHKVRNSLYRPFTKSHLFFDSIMNDEVSSFPSIFPTPETGKEESSDLRQFIND